MEPSKSLDNVVNVIAALLCDVQTLHSDVFTQRACRLTIAKIRQRYAREGIGFLTKSLPRLGKHFDKCLAGIGTFDPANERKLKGSKLPRFLGELFGRVFTSDGQVLPNPCVRCIASLRDILYLFYKYEVPYKTDQELDVIEKFVKTELEVQSLNEALAHKAKVYHASKYRWRLKDDPFNFAVIRRARVLLARVLSSFNPKEIVPRHGPGAVSTKEKLEGKYRWSNIPDRVSAIYPIDEYFYTSLSHVCDAQQEIQSLGDRESPARVILVPKDSRGPRLISCEPLYLQWIQQGVSRALVQHVERHPLTRCRVNFTDQGPNRRAALIGSRDGRYATLDLNEASDRVSLGLVHLLFPEWFTTYLEATRSQSTQLPNGEVITLHKFAPMGSALCFPVLALTVWAILNAATSDADTRERILVYGDDVIVPTAYAGHAIEQLESFGLKINRDKSCTSGFFRESCGMDAYRGENVTPVRLRTVWSSTPSPGVYTSWISYANSLYAKRYSTTYELIVQNLIQTYGEIPSSDVLPDGPSLSAVSVYQRGNIPRRWNSNLQKFEYKVRVVTTRSEKRNMPGWSKLLRYFCEGCSKPSGWSLNSARKIHYADAVWAEALDNLVRPPFTASQYTSRDTSKLVYRWR